jgi:hypothetical protein
MVKCGLNIIINEQIKNITSKKFLGKNFKILLAKDLSLYICH